jgi:hypothetical protein
MAIDYKPQGRKVISVFLRYYQTYNKKLLTQDELLSKILNYEHDKYLQILGSAFVNGLDSDSDKLDSAMDELASASIGAYPTSDSLLSYMREQNGFISLVKEVSTNVGGDLYDGVQSFSANALGLVKFLNAVFPIVIVGGIAFFIFVNKDLLNLKNLKK